MVIKIKKTKRIFFVVHMLLCALFVTIFSSPKAVAAEAFTYKLLEQFPGFFNQGDSPSFPQLLSALYSFGIWTVGIAAFFMLVIGGFMYITSAGNTSMAGSAKKVITDAILGLVAALVAYLVLYVVNPDLVNLNLNLISVGITSQGVRYEEGASGGTGSFTCSPQTSGQCSIQKMTAAFGDNASKASGICFAESGASPNSLSGVDRCRGNGTNDPVSIGLFQINISVHKIGGLDCPKAFNRAYTAAIARDKTKCWVVDRNLYNNCVRAAKDPANNIAVAKRLSQNGNNWSQWGANRLCHY